EGEREVRYCHGTMPQKPLVRVWSRGPAPIPLRSIGAGPELALANRGSSLSLFQTAQCSLRVSLHSPPIRLNSSGHFFHDIIIPREHGIIAIIEAEEVHNGGIQVRLIGTVIEAGLAEDPEKLTRL